MIDWLAFGGIVAALWCILYLLWLEMKRRGG